MLMISFRIPLLIGVGFWVGCDAVRVPEQESVEWSESSQALVEKDDHQLTKDRRQCRAAQRARLVKTTIGTPVAIAVGVGVGAMVIASGDITTGMTPLSKAVAGLSIVGAFKGSQFLTSSGVNALRALLKGKRRTVCCCDAQNSCNLRSVQGRFRRSVCPDDDKHEADRCGGAPEVVTYSDNTTVQNCLCTDFTHCASNRFYRGHAWCHTEGQCGYQSLRRWDFCRFSETSAIPDEVTETTALSFFVPHTHRLGERLRRVVGVRSWTDPLRGVAVGKPSFLSFRRQCFVGIPEETVEGCAQKCIELGAPSTQKDNNYNCSAFAYHRKLSLCVRLASFVDDAVFTPFMRNIDGDGWQNFVLDTGARQQMAILKDALGAGATGAMLYIGIHQLMKLLALPIPQKLAASGVQSVQASLNNLRVSCPENSAAVNGDCECTDKEKTSKSYITGRENYKLVIPDNYVYEHLKFEGLQRSEQSWRFEDDSGAVCQFFKCPVRARAVYGEGLCHCGLRETNCPPGTSNSGKFWLEGPKKGLFTPDAGCCCGSSCL